MACDILVENILSSYQSAMKLLDCMAMLENGDPSQMRVSNVFGLPNSIEGSPTSEGSGLNSKDHKCNKRKKLPKSKWIEQVRVRTVCEGQLDDGYNWRKYGQKDILGATHPRAYYRCTHRKTQGCLAMKQVQRAHDDPSIFEVIYRGKHSCMQERLKQDRENLIVPKKEDQDSPIHSQETTITNETSLKIENQELVAKEDHFPSFSFNSTPIESENFETRFFPEASNFIGTQYPPLEFLSPATSDSYFSMPQCPANDLGKIISNPTPLTSFSFGDLDISVEQIDFSSQFFEAIDYF
uniref:WRKY family protein 7 n=1 Tax=Cistanche tubulosa TaxID=161397 RepID=A0A6B9EXN5_9LAMI|nr:WRKY family protein 7 [Cistanche tubulosa]